MNARATEQIEAQAAAWVLKRDRGELSREDRATLEAWLMADSRHRAAYLRLDHAWRCTAGLKTWRPRDGVVDADVLVRAAASRSGCIPARRWVAVSALALIIAVAILGWLTVSSPGETFATRIGGYQRILLDDGSVLQLNTNSTARVRITSAHRKVQLLRGEAYFEVAHDPSRPFDVVVGETVVRAVGTAFAVRLREKEGVEVTVTQGRVAVRAEGAITERGATAAPERESSNLPQSFISAGEVVQSRASGFVVERLDESELRRRLAWQSGQLAFDREPLIAVVAEFNRYNRKRVEIADPALESVEVGGNFKATDLDSFIGAMRSALNVRIEETDESIRLFAP